MEKYTAKTLAETAEAARKFGKTLKNGDFVALIGDMGAGKTAFTRGVVEALIPEAAMLVHSPTFTVVNEYVSDEVSVFHFDFYRLKSEDDLYSCGFSDYFDRDGIIIAEWADMFPDSIPQGAITVTIKATPEAREITVCR